MKMHDKLAGHQSPDPPLPTVSVAGSLSGPWFLVQFLKVIMNMFRQIIYILSVHKRMPEVFLNSDVSTLKSV
jgi:hypothetical protein